jgi:hypothetical protein
VAAEEGVAEAAVEEEVAAEGAAAAAEGDDAGRSVIF